eukprot:7602882-Lingulodinium_polyedra.AAC.1
MAPKQKGACIWHEKESNRIRCAMYIDGVKTTRSQPVSTFGEEKCILWCLRFLWHQHVLSGGEPSQYAALNEKPEQRP